MDRPFEDIFHLKSELAENHVPSLEKSQFPHLEAIQSLMSLMLGTHHYLAFAVGELHPLCESPIQAHWNAVNQVLRKINCTRDLVMFPSESAQLELSGLVI